MISFPIGAAKRTPLGKHSHAGRDHRAAQAVAAGLCSCECSLYLAGKSL
jgi:hypothetical protein